MKQCRRGQDKVDLRDMSQNVRELFISQFNVPRALCFVGQVNLYKYVHFIWNRFQIVLAWNEHLPSLAANKLRYVITSCSAIAIQARVVYV